jgi:hypothetical protein
MTLIELGQMIKPVLFCVMSLFSVLSLFILANMERND